MYGDSHPAYFYVQCWTSCPFTLQVYSRLETDRHSRLLTGNFVVLINSELGVRNLFKTFHVPGMIWTTIWHMRWTVPSDERSRNCTSTFTAIQPSPSFALCEQMTTYKSTVSTIPIQKSGSNSQAKLVCSLKLFDHKAPHGVISLVRNYMPSILPTSLCTLHR